MARIRSLPLYELWYPQVTIIQDTDAATKHLEDIYPDIPREGYTVGVSITLTHTNNIRLVSVCHSDSVYTFDIKLIGAFPPHLRCLLEDEDVVKIGHGILNIAWRLYHEHGIKLTMGGEISRLHRIFNTRDTTIGEPFNNPVPLSAIAERWLEKTIVNEYIQCRWVDIFELVHYKQASAIAGIVGQSYHAMREGNRVDSVANKYWIFTSVEYATGTVLGRCEEFPLHTLADTSCIEPLRRASDRIRATLSEANLHIQRIGIQTNTEHQYPRIVRLCDDIERAILTYDQSVEEPEQQ